MACGSLILFRCFGGATIRDFETELTSQGYACVLVHGTEHSVYRCTGGAGVVDITSNGSLSSEIVAWSRLGPPIARSRTMFEIVAPSPFPRDAPHARQARSWIDANLEGRAHQATIAGYSYIVSAQPWSILTILA